MPVWVELFEMRSLTSMDLNQLKLQLNGLATAKERPVIYVEKAADGSNIPVEVKDYKAIINEKTGKVENMASKNYVIIQHNEAFSAVIDALAATKGGSPFKASVMEQNGKAWMTVVFEDAVADDGAKGIEIGLSISNSYDGTSALKFGGSQNKFNREISIGLYGLRLSCMNGNVISFPIGDITSIVEAVPKKEAKVGDIIGYKTKTILNEKLEPQAVARTSIRHMGQNVQINLEQMRQIILALPQVAKRLEERIKAAQQVSLSSEEANVRLEELGFGPRLREKILTRFKQEEQTIWGLYNGSTSEMTHGKTVSPQRMENGLKQAERLLTAPMKVKN
jgi:hypothetical protein